MRFRNVGQRLGAGFAVAFVLLGFVGLTAYSNVGIIEDNQTKVVHTYQVLAKLESVLDTIREGETGQQGYLATGQDSYLASFTEAKGEIGGAIDAVATLTADNASQQKRIAALRPLVAAKFAEMKGTIDLRRKSGLGAAQKGTLEDKGTATTDPINSVMAEMESAESALLTTRTTAAHSAVVSTRWVSIGGSLVALALLVTIAWLLTRSITRPVRDLVTNVRAMADGDLTRHSATDRTDELGQLATEFNRFADKTSATIRSISSSATELTSASQSLTGVNQQIASNAGQASEQAADASAAAGQVSSNVETVAASSEEMGASIKEIASSAANAAEVSLDAVNQAAQAVSIMAKLGESSSEIGDIIKLITSIAEQTNLLALNATIEAARAGDAGKGFAVVANEVKDLAQETARATDDISVRVQAVQQETRQAIDIIGQITHVVEQVSSHSAVIAAAVEQQTPTTNEIIRNVSEASNGSGAIAGNIAAVAEAAGRTSSSVEDSRRAADELARMARSLEEVVGQFRV